MCDHLLNAHIWRFEMTRRLFCDDSPVSYEATPADAPRAHVAVPAQTMTAPASRITLSAIRFCDDAPVSYEATPDAVR